MQLHRSLPLLERQLRRKYARLSSLLSSHYARFINTSTTVCEVGSTTIGSEDLVGGGSGSPRRSGAVEYVLRVAHLAEEHQQRCIEL